MSAIEEVKAYKKLKLLFLPPTWAFPAFDIWEFFEVKKLKETVKARGTLEIYRGAESGWLMYAFCDANSPDLRLRVDVTTVPVPLEIDVSFKELYEAGLVRPQDKFFWISRYDDTEKKYCACYTPSGLGVPFREEIRAHLFNPTDTDALVRRAIMAILRLKIPGVLVKEWLKFLAE